MRVVEDPSADPQDHLAVTVHQGFEGEVVSVIAPIDESSDKLASFKPVQVPESNRLCRFRWRVEARLSRIGSSPLCGVSALIVS